jgi:5-formyltetrahydrofolate cyclo-ligase
MPNLSHGRSPACKAVPQWPKSNCVHPESQIEKLDAIGVTNLFDIKKQSRRSARTLRQVAHAQLQETAPLILASHQFPVELKTSHHIVSAFYPYQSEIDTRPLLGKLAGEGWTTCLPIVLGEGLPLQFRRWAPGAPTIPGVWGIPRPPNEADEIDPDVLIIPLLSFDRQGYRLGYGGGFYDRTIEKLRTRKNIIAIGVGYAAQEVDHVPIGAHDQPLDFVMTEKEVIKLRA